MDSKELRKAQRKFDELLISEVFKYPNLYDLKRKDFKNVVLRHETWTAIAAVLATIKGNIINIIYLPTITYCLTFFILLVFIIPVYFYIILLNLFCRREYNRDM